MPDFNNGAADYDQAIKALARREKNDAIKFLNSAYEKNNLHTGFLSTILTINCSPSSQIFQNSVAYYQIDFRNRDDVALLITLGEFYLTEETKKDLAFALFAEATKHNSAKATVLLGTCYEKGIGTLVDKDKARELYLRSSLMN